MGHAKIKSDGATVYINDDEVVVASRLKRAEDCANDDRGAIYSQIQGAFKELALKPAANEAGGLISSAFFPGCSPAVAGAASRCPSHHAEEVHFYARGLIPESTLSDVYTCVLTVDKVKHTVAGTVRSASSDGSDLQKLSCTLPKAIHATEATFYGHVDVYQHGYHKVPMIDDMENPIVEFYNQGPVVKFQEDMVYNVVDLAKPGLLLVDFEVEDYIDAPQDLTVIVTSNDEAIVNTSNIMYDPASKKLALQIEPAYLAAFTVAAFEVRTVNMITVNASDTGGGRSISAIALKITNYGLYGQCYKPNPADYKYIGRESDTAGTNSEGVWTKTTRTAKLKEGEYADFKHVTGNGGAGYRTADGKEIFDGISGRWGAAGSSYKQSRDNAGGFEIMFRKKVTVTKVQFDCIKNNDADAAAGTKCYSNTGYSIPKGTGFFAHTGENTNAQKWNEAARLTDTALGNRILEYPKQQNGNLLSKAWKFWLPTKKQWPGGGHPGNNAQIHMSDIAILEMCPCTASAGCVWNYE